MSNLQMNRAIVENSFLYHGGDFAGISLGYAPGSEHEWGFAQTLLAIGAGQGTGLDRYRVGMAEGLYLTEHDGVTSLSLLLVNSKEEAARFVEGVISSCSVVSFEPTVWWQDGQFIIAASGENRALLRSLADDFASGNVALGLPSGTETGVRYPVFVRGEYLRINREAEHAVH